MNILYKNQRGDTAFPFTSSIPFPAQCISYIKLVLKTSTQIPLVTTIANKNRQLFIQLSTDSKYLGRFQLKDSLYDTIDNNQVFGFVQLAKMPVQDFYFHGKWLLDRSCYTYSMQLRGLQQAYVQNTCIKQGDLQLQFIGDFTIRQSSDSKVINIGRDTASTHQDYTENQRKQLSAVQSTTSRYVTSINDVSAKSVNIYSNDSTISVQNPIAISEDVYVMYINSLQGFPACLQESDSTQ